MMAAPNLIEAESVLGIAKVITIGVMSGFVSFTVNDKAIKAGAKLASHGFRFAFLGSVFAHHHHWH
ncbi:hypothetical protein [uncultured Cohaesibacter sp.]|uniref:hypothetical protein n=1 Tax=uncultured Cohaesibacter sp. TaxID=1002546 RepID=UPI00292D9851|nr:hypothetical protein [uncultured Cohaesibacter sp.]